MSLLCIILAAASVPATFLLSNLFWRGFRETRGIAMFLSSPEYLQRIVTSDLLNRPPAEIERFAQPQTAGFASNMRAFREADQKAHNRGRSILRPVLLALILGSGFFGYLAFRWLGLAFPIINLFVLLSTFMASTQGSLDRSTVERAAEHVQIVAVILYRWYAVNPLEATEWVEGESQMKPLWEILTNLRTP
ncbi:MAG TPA: hypothetical protein VEX43_11500 [Chthoniobacterales bacterium]|nr:hypothetical protein [Chthoniobacterales bacterium]